MRKKYNMTKTALIILDGFWINNISLEENSIYKANTTNFDKLFNNLYTQLDASWLSVWIPEQQMWNSEVGHMTIWAWKIIRQSLVKINDLFSKNEFKNISSFQGGINHVLENNSILHLFILFGSGWVHSHSNHLIEILKIISKNIQVSLHLFGDGRDLEPQSMLGFYSEFEKNILSNYKNVVVSSISGRYYAMDRDDNWNRVKMAYDTIFFGNNKTSLTPKEFIVSQYEKQITDEFLTPTFFEWWYEIGNWDSIFFLNFRSDRARELTQSIMQKDFDWFETKKIENLYFASMTKYYKEFEWKYFVEDEKVTNCLAEVLQNNNLTQLHIAETEKFAHVTKFFNWGKQIVFEWEKDILIPSHKVATYDLDPEMSAEEIYQEFEKNALNYDFTLVNFANGDMVWHTWNMEASIKSVEKLDEIIWKIIYFSSKNNINLLITADHWNCEEMWSLDNPKTSHTLNKVPFWYIVDKEIIKTKSTWWLANIAPTILNIMKIEKLEWMDESLV